MAPYDDIDGTPAIRAALDALDPRVLADRRSARCSKPGVDIESSSTPGRGSSRWRSVAPAPIRGATFRTRTRGRDGGVRTTRSSIVPDMSRRVFPRARPRIESRCGVNQEDSSVADPACIIAALARYV